MAVTLDAALAAAQENQSRRPLVEITSTPRVADIPFDGTRLTAESFEEYAPSIISHSSGRLILAYVYHDGVASGIKFVVSDVDRTVFTTYTKYMFSYASNEAKSVSICELTNGNIGMILLVNNKSGSLYKLKYRILNLTGTFLSSADISPSWSNSIFTGDPWVITKAADSYLIVYTKKSGSNYYVYKRTSTNFTTWSAESALSISGLTSTWKLSNPSLLKISTGDLWLWFDVVESTGPTGEELTNIYYSTSSDGGATWSAATKFTSYAEYSETGKHPVALQKVANQITMMFTKYVSALKMDDTASGWPDGDICTNLTFDAVNRKLYVVNVNTGYNRLSCVVKIDVDAWTVDKYWNSTSTPSSFPSFMFLEINSVYPYCHKGDGYIIPIAVQARMSGGQWDGGVCLLDGQADTIKQYWFETDAVRGVTENVDIPDPGNSRWGVRVQIDVASDRMYILLSDLGNITNKFILGYVSLSDPGSGDPVMYTWNTVLEVSWSNSDLAGLGPADRGGFLVVPDDDMVIVSSCSAGGVAGRLGIYQLSDGALLKDYKYSSYPSFPYQGISGGFHYAEGKIWGGIIYHSGDGQADYRGLCELDLDSDICTYKRPTYSSIDDYALRQVIEGPDNSLIISSYGYGIAVFDTISSSWVLYSNTNISGMTPDGYNYFWPVCYDSLNEFVFTGAVDISPPYPWNGLIKFSIYGSFYQSNYSIGEWDVDHWEWSAIDELVQGYLDHEAVGVPDPETTTSMFVFWTHETWDGSKAIKWDKDGSTLDLAEFLVGEIATERSIDGKVASLTFSVSHGHLFDPYNLGSFYNSYLKKGRKLILRFGEKILGVDYWQNAGTFFVTEISLKYERGEYPVMQVVAEDQRCIWEHHHVYATDLYNDLPEVIIEDVLTDFAGLEAGDLNIPAFEGGTVLQHQWLDTTIDEIINQVCNRFGYFFRFDVDGLASARRITNAGSIDHTYSNNTKLVRYSPDDKYSDFTNRVTVQGQELDFTQVLFAEEAVGSLNGTVGWWGCRKDFDVWYSADRSRQCLNPRLEIIETATSIAFKLAGNISESLAEGTAEGYENRYCIITVSAPNLIPVLLAAIGIYIAGNFIGDIIAAAGFIVSSGVTIPLGRKIEGVGLLLAMMVLGATGNYQYSIHACPVGSVRRSVQSSWDDEEAQAEIGSIIEQVIDDPLCYSVADCAAVAAFEGMVAQMQRRRITMTKIAHLQDEEGDTIRMAHPYSGQNIDLFVTNLKRKFKKADSSGGDGYFLDEIEGWVIS
jgi:hypothetical protein